MLISGGQIYAERREPNVLISSQYEIRWRGLVYLDDVPAGLATLRKFAEGDITSIADSAAQLKGVYFVALRDRQSGHCYVFVDSSGLYHAYYTDQLAGTSFLELAVRLGIRPRDVDPEALVEFLHFGCIYEDKTLFSQIRKIAPDVIVCVKPGGTNSLLRKHVADIAIPAERSLESALKSFAIAAAGERISLDLTGGIDSRLLAVVLNYFGLPFELAASGIRGNKDLVIAEKIAAILGRDFHATYHDIKQTDWKLLLEICDGLFDVAKANRPAQLQRERKQRGITLAVSGAGGELFKDFWWLQDFPFYTSRKPRLKRLYSMRIAPTEPHHSLLAGPYRAISRNYREQMLGSLSQYIAIQNTQTYDRVYYSFKMRGFAGRFLTNGLYFLQTCAPCLERDAVRIGYSLPRRCRFFNRYHRQLITHFAVDVARIPTTEGGMSASSEASAIFCDLRNYVLDRSKRIAQKIGQKVLGKTYLQESADDQQMDSHLLRLIVERRSIERLKDYGILSNALQVSEIKSSYLGSLLVLDDVFDKLESNVSCSPAQKHANRGG